MWFKDFVSFFMYFIISVFSRRDTVPKTQQNCKKKKPKTKTPLHRSKETSQTRKGISVSILIINKWLGFSEAIIEYLYDDCKAERVYFLYKEKCVQNKKKKKITCSVELKSFAGIMRIVCSQLNFVRELYRQPSYIYRSYNLSHFKPWSPRNFYVHAIKLDLSSLQ